jgi:hypothetical protein
MRESQGRFLRCPLTAAGLAFVLLVMAICRASSAEWVLPDDRLGIRTAPLLLLSRPDVQADLKLDRSQVLGAQSRINELTRRALALRGKTGAAVVADRRAIDEAQLEWLGKNLTGNQLERLWQIELQWEGASALLGRPMVVEYLRLTPEQQHALATILAERNRLHSKGRYTPAEDQAFNRKANTVLSKSQQELLTKLLGAPFQFAATAAPAHTRDEAAHPAGHRAPTR